ncbi:hypothetical protein FRB90_007108, partial [Tulasnella sp. 427]
MVFGPDRSSDSENGFSPLRTSGAFLQFDQVTSISIEEDAETDQILRYYLQLNSETDSVFPTMADEPDGNGTPRDGLDWIRSNGRVQLVDQHSEECEGCELLKKKLEFGEREGSERDEDQ